jgi:hypothetical protein
MSFADIIVTITFTLLGLYPWWCEYRCLCGHKDSNIECDARPKLSRIPLQLKADVSYFMCQAEDEGVEVDIVDLACSLTCMGYDTKVRYAEGGGTNCFKNLFHEFLLIKVR